MPKTFMFLIIGLFFGTGFGFVLAASFGAQIKGHHHGGAGAHDHAAHGQGAHDHAILDISGDGPAPTIEIILHPDGPQSRNLELKVGNFSFAPQAVNGPHSPGQGHAHLYINDVKISRLYGPWAQLNALPQGTHEVRVTLNSNDHSQLSIGDQPIEAVQTLIIE